MTTECVIEGCRRQRGPSRGMCHTHYAHFLQFGDPLAGKFFSLRESTLADKLQQEIDAIGGSETDGCWEYTRATTYYLHRVSYEHFVGPIQADMTLDHLCRNPKCFRPDHLEQVTRGDNIRRGFASRKVVA